MSTTVEIKGLSIDPQITKLSSTVEIKGLSIDPQIKSV